MVTRELLNMIDFDKIGERIKEQRKCILKVSQEKMAEELNMYQADISNLEKAKSGSGINDLEKLDRIADFLKVSPEYLIFGSNRSMAKYNGNKMKLKRSKSKISKTRLDILQDRIGSEADISKVRSITYECGDYLIVTLCEDQLELDHESKQMVLSLMRFHTYIFLGDEIIAVMVADPTTVMQHVYQPSFQHLCEAIPSEVLQPADFYRIINPYQPLYLFCDDNEQGELYRTEMFKRMDAIRETGQNRTVFYVESIYVREDCRRNGILRMYIDILKDMQDGCIIWMNMEPTSGYELENEYTCTSTYTVSELGQLSLNASIAEKLGFTVDPEPWHRQAETLDADGNIRTEVVSVRKCAYFFPKEIRDLIKNDGDLVAKGYALQKLKNSKTENETEICFDNGECDGYLIGMYIENVVADPDAGKKTYFYAAYSESEDKYKFGVSCRSVILNGLNHDGQSEEYEYLDDAVDSESFDNLCAANSMLQVILNTHS